MDTEEIRTKRNDQKFEKSYAKQILRLAGIVDTRYDWNIYDTTAAHIITKKLII